jgi:hypothetical protein
MLYKIVSKVFLGDSLPTYLFLICAKGFWVVLNQAEGAGFIVIV